MVTHSSMSILVFGGTGRTGTHFIDTALAAGHTVTAVAHRPEAIVQRHPNLRVVQGDVLQPGTFMPLVRGQDALVSCLGVNHRKSTTVLSTGVGNMLTAMKSMGVSRLMCISAAGIEVNPKASWPLRMATKYVLQRVFRHLYADTRLMEAMLKRSDVNWTSVRPPMLTNGPMTGRYQYEINDFLASSFQISRADLAHFMVHHLNDPALFRAIVDVAN